MSKAKSMELLKRLQDEALENLRKASDEDVSEEVAEDGEDIAAIAGSLRTDILERLAAERNRCLTEECKSDIADRPQRQAPTIDERVWGEVNLERTEGPVSPDDKRAIASSAFVKLCHSYKTHHYSYISFGQAPQARGSRYSTHAHLIEHLLSTYITESEDLADLFPGTRAITLRSLLHDAIRDPQVSSFMDISLATLASTLCTLAFWKASGFEFEAHGANARSRMLRRVRSSKEWRAFHRLMASQPELVADSVDGTRAVSGLATMQCALAQYKPDAIVAVAGGGEIVGSFLRAQIGLDARRYFVASRTESDYTLNRDLFGLQDLKKVVIVDDISRTGRTLASIRNQTFGGVTSVEFKGLALVYAAAAANPAREFCLALPVVAQSSNVSVPWDNKGSYRATRTNYVFGADKLCPLKVPKIFYDRIYGDLAH